MYPTLGLIKQDIWVPPVMTTICCETRDLPVFDRSHKIFDRVGLRGIFWLQDLTSKKRDTFYTSFGYMPMEVDLVPE